jgi:asparagine synthase (glutamine-hydrolysing)
MNIIFLNIRLKSIKKFFGFKNILSKVAINYFIKWGFITAPLCIYKNIYKLEPGEFIEVDNNINITKNKYWRLSENIKNQDLKESNLNFKESLNDLENLIDDSVRRTLVSDVPLGCFLSSGIDSSIITYFANKNSKKKIKTFSIGFKESEFNESEGAKKIADYIGTEHHSIYFSNEDIITHFDALDEIYDEPFADSSQLPTSLISEYSKKSVSVVLSGDGGDELFGGYSRINEYDSQKSDTFDELSFYHLPRLDKMSMAHTLELRSPFLNLDIVRFALHLPLDWRKGKQILKDTFSPLLPPEVVNRKKEALKNPKIKEDKLAYRQHAVDLFLDL